MADYITHIWLGLLVYIDILLQIRDMYECMTQSVWEGDASLQWCLHASYQTWRPRKSKEPRQICSQSLHFSTGRPATCRSFFFSKTSTEEGPDVQIQVALATMPIEQNHDWSRSESQQARKEKPPSCFACSDRVRWRSLSFTWTHEHDAFLL
jgi:hypothetical protein